MNESNNLLETQGNQSPGNIFPDTVASEDAISILTKDHDDARKLFTVYQELTERDAEPDERLSIAKEICNALTLHATVEEEIFYPAIRSLAEDTKNELAESEVEHATQKELVSQIKAMLPEDDLYNAKIKVLGEYVDHHAREEEEQMFPKAINSSLDLVALGITIKARKEELQTSDPVP